jgi:glycine/D-amino acid oxidase-like deaminating enzyme
MRRRAVVIGGGISGVLSARQLLLAGWHVTLVEAAHLGAGSSSRTAAGIRQQFSTVGTVRALRYCVSFYSDLASELPSQERPLQQNGYLFLYAEPEAWANAQARVALQRSVGLAEVEALGAQDLVGRFPWLSAEAGLLGGSWCPTDGFLFPHLLYNEGAERVRQLGGLLLQGAEVLGARREGDRLVALETSRGALEADLFLDCTNAWTNRLAARLGASALPVDPLKRYLWFFPREEALPADTLQAMPLVVLPSGVYARPENRGLVQVGRAHDTPPEPSFTYEDQDRVDPAFDHSAGADGLAFQSWVDLATWIPAFADLGAPVATTGGYYGTTPDHNPFLGYDPHLRNLIRLVGFSGHGAMMGPFTAWVGAALAEAGQDLPEVRLPDGGTVALDAFQLRRDFRHAEAMVI